MNTKIDFLSGSVKRCFFTMAIPMVFAMYLNMAYNLVDSIWIGNLLGETAYAALTGATPIILIFTSIAMGATNGISILLSQAIGANDIKRAEGLIATSLIGAVVFSLAATAFLECALPAVLVFLQTPDETYDMAYRYLSVYMLGYLAVFLFLYFTAVLRSFGNSMFQAAAMLGATLLNAILDPFFIWLFGFQGAAIATLLSQIVCLCFMIGYLKRKKLFSLRLSLFSKTYLASLILKAVPSVIQQTIPALSTAFLTTLVGSYAISALAAYGIAGKLEMLLVYPAMAFNLVLTAITGQCKGAGRFDRARDYTSCAVWYGGGLILLLSAAVVLFSRQLSFMFVRSSETAQIVSTYFMIVGTGYIFNVLTNCCLGLLCGLGKPSKSMFLMILYYIVIRMPLAFVLSETQLGLNGIWTAVLLSHICAAGAAALVVRREMGIRISAKYRI